jgi:hypothetical protein
MKTEKEKGDPHCHVDVTGGPFFSLNLLKLPKTTILDIIISVQ